MKEIVFLNRNVDRWKQLEKILRSPKGAHPDLMADLFIQLTDDLSYSRTYFPNSNITKYLNDLTLQSHYLIYKNKKEKSDRIKIFWKYELPLLVWNHRKYLLYAFLIFFLAILIGVISTANDPTFVRLILGDDYVNMTLENIKKGDPLAVYKSMKSFEMFVLISVNNIYVSFLAFIFGLLLSVGTAYILFLNGIMLGCFQFFFYQYGLLWQSVLTIWIHGTLEIFAVLLAGTAGIMMGNSILFPGTYSRLHSFKNGVKSGLKIIIGIIPVFVIAAILESFVTRHTQLPVWVRFGIICLSVLSIIFYFFVYPSMLIKKFKL
jgi:uncharacterized membrane protein SpoIIM required for sporulation